MLACPEEPCSRRQCSDELSPPHDFTELIQYLCRWHLRWFEARVVTPHRNMKEEAAFPHNAVPEIAPTQDKPTIRVPRCEGSVIPSQGVRRPKHFFDDRFVPDRGNPSVP